MAAGTSRVDENVFHDVDAYVQAQIADNTKFWSRLGGRPDLRGQDVLDFGCGHGTLSLNCAEAGARSVLGVDLSDQRIAYARARFQPKSMALRFECSGVDELPAADRFDCIVSKDVMEHVTPLGPVLRSLANRLKPQGRLILGFSPLWFSPWGDHGELGTQVPWAHVLAGERRILAAFNRRNQSDCVSLPEAGYNMLPPSAFMAAIHELGLVQERLRFNPHEGGVKGVLMEAMNVARRVPGLERYFTSGIYGIWRKPE